MCRLSWSMGASTSWNPQGLSRPVMGLLYLFFFLTSASHIMSRIHLSHAFRSHILKISLNNIFISTLRFSKSLPQVQSYKICWAQKINFFFHFRCSFCRPVCRPVDCAAQGGRNTCPRPLATPLHLLELHINPLKPELNPICYLLALLAHHFLHVSRIRVKSLTLRWLMSYIYGAPILDVSRSHTTTQHSR